MLTLCDLSGGGPGRWQLLPRGRAQSAHPGCGQRGVRGSVHQLVTEKSNKDLRKLGLRAKFNRRKVNVKSYTLGANANCVRWNEGDAEGTNTDLFVVEHHESLFKKWGGGDAIVGPSATTLAPEPGSRRLGLELGARTEFSEGHPAASLEGRGWWGTQSRRAGGKERRPLGPMLQKGSTLAVLSLAAPPGRWSAVPCPARAKFSRMGTPVQKEETRRRP